MKIDKLITNAKIYSKCRYLSKNNYEGFTLYKKCR